MSDTESEKKARRAAYKKEYQAKNAKRISKVKRKHYLANRERILAQVADYRRKNPDKLAAYRRKNRKKIGVSNALNMARQRASKFGVPFDLTLASLPPVPDTCPWLGMPLEFGSDWANSPSIDRIIPALGYVPGNIHWISRKANSIKNCATLEELIRVTLGLQQLLADKGNDEAS